MNWRLNGQCRKSGLELSILSGSTQSSKFLEEPTVARFQEVLPLTIPFFPISGHNLSSMLAIGTALGKHVFNE